MRQPDYNAATCYTTFKDGAWRLMDGYAKEVYCFKDEEEKKAIAQALVDNIWNAYRENHTRFLINFIQTPQKPVTKKFYLYCCNPHAPFVGAYFIVSESDSIDELKSVEHRFIYSWIKVTKTGNPILEQDKHKGNGWEAFE